MYIKKGKKFISGLKLERVPVKTASREERKEKNERRGRYENLVCLGA